MLIVSAGAILDQAAHRRQACRKIQRPTCEIMPLSSSAE